ncbi:MAG: hypothetical protein NUW22_13555 [Acidobacteria bacterium]|nr:hypothetical protein [Acidobacteriota bacterium]
MDRRRFLHLFGAAAAGLALDPERALWVPGAKRIFLPLVVHAVPSLAFHPDAFTFVMAPLSPAQMQAQYNQMWSQVLEQIEVNTAMPTRLDCLYGVATLRDDRRLRRVWTPTR